MVPDKTAPSLLLKLVQSPELSAPLLVAEAVGILNVCVLPDEVMPILVPVSYTHLDVYKRQWYAYIPITI